MSSNTSTSIATLRDIIASSGYSYRVNDDDLRSIAQSPNPRETCERIVRNLGGSPRDFSNLIDRVVAAVQAPTQGTPQDSAPDTAEVEEGTLTEIADRLRTFAAGQGLPSAMVEEALVYAGLVQPEPEDEEDVPEGDQNAINAAILATLKKMNKRLKDIKSVL